MPVGGVMHASIGVMLDNVGVIYAVGVLHISLGIDLHTNVRLIHASLGVMHSSVEVMHASGGVCMPVSE